MVVASGIGASVVGVVPSANAATSDGVSHFLKISTHGAPVWKATGDLYAGDGTNVYHWSQGLTSGGGAVWRFTYYGDGGHASVSVEAGTGPYTVGYLALDRDHCFLVDAGGSVRYTGDSMTGGCNLS
jgi:hypothetical protein